MAELRFDNINKFYENKVQAIKDFNLKINDREFVVLVGPSGCGKSTVLRIVAGLEEISSGQLYIDDKCVNDLDPKDRDIAMVFQNYALYPHKNVYDNLSFGLKIRKIDKDTIDKKVKEVSKILDLEELLKRKPAQLSGGQKQRVALGRAIIREPKVFLMDEPLSNLDAKLRADMRSEIIKLQKRLQTTMIYVTHDQTEAMTMGDRIVILKDGEVQQIGKPDDIYRKPNNLFVAEFIGSPSINILDYDDFKLIFKFDCDKLDSNNVVGIRPENLEIIEGDDFIVSVVENLGSEKLIHLENGEVKMVVKNSGLISCDRTEKVSVKIKNPELLNYFDKQTGNAVFNK